MPSTVNEQEDGREIRLRLLLVAREGGDGQQQSGSQNGKRNLHEQNGARWRRGAATGRPSSSRRTSANARKTARSCPTRESRLLTRDTADTAMNLPNTVPAGHGRYEQGFQCAALLLARHAVVGKIDAAHKRGHGKHVGQERGEQQGADARPALYGSSACRKGVASCCGRLFSIKRSATSRLPRSSNSPDSRPAASCDACDP